jgi:NADH-quinone oxidoreductase subunit C
MNPKQPPAEMSTSPWESELTVRLANRFGSRISEFAAYLGQNFLIAAPEAVIPILEYLKIEEHFDYLTDLSAVDYPNRAERFELIYILYSFSTNQRVRVKTRISDTHKLQTATGVYLSANWLEREVFDMFGIDFAGHPDMRRILLPDDWRGHPLRKDYAILQMDNQWVQENLGIESGQ